MRLLLWSPPVDRGYSSESRPARHLTAQLLVCFAAPQQDNKWPRTSVFNIIMPAIKTHSNEGKRGLLWDKETDPKLLSTKPGDHRNSLISTTGAQSAKTWCPNQGSWHPRCRVWDGGHPGHWSHVTTGAGPGGGPPGDCGRVTPGAGLGLVRHSPHPHGSGSCPQRPRLCCSPQYVLLPLSFPASELRVLP